MEIKRGQIFILTGPSGVGKTEILKRLLANPSLNLQRVITCTTRAKREGEIDGKDYFFISKEQFLKELKENKFFEHAEVYGNYYGSRKDEVEKILHTGKNVIFQLDPQGAENLKRMDEHCKVIFIKAENLDSMKDRLLGRNADSDEALAKRLAAAQKEIDNSAQFDFVVTNYTGKLGEAVRDIEKIIENS
ncbi:MAG: guanylate kinase [archaeon]